MSEIHKQISKTYLERKYHQDATEESVAENRFFTQKINQNTAHVYRGVLVFSTMVIPSCASEW